MPDDLLDRIALIATLVARAPTPPGRTALMKCLFFLKALKGMPLPYNFRLYTYGPFDSDVLDDLRYAQSLGAVQSSLVTYPGGRGYAYTPGPKAEEINTRAAEFLNQHEDSIDWVIGAFGNRSAMDLEMISTLVYIDRSTAQVGRTRITLGDLARKVRDVKPHLAIEAIEREARALRERGLLTAVA